MLRHMTTKVKCRSSGNSALWLAVMEEKIVHESTVKLATSKSNGKHTCRENGFLPCNTVVLNPEKHNMVWYNLIMWGVPQCRYHWKYACIYCNHIMQDVFLWNCCSLSDFTDPYITEYSCDREILPFLV